MAKYNNNNNNNIPWIETLVTPHRYHKIYNHIVRMIPISNQKGHLGIGTVPVISHQYDMVV